MATRTPSPESAGGGEAMKAQNSKKKVFKDCTDDRSYRQRRLQQKAVRSVSLRLRCKAKVPDAGKCGKGIDEGGHIDKGAFTIKRSCRRRRSYRQRPLYQLGDRIDDRSIDKGSCIDNGGPQYLGSASMRGESSPTPESAARGRLERGKKV
jgi:hypothetical protein